LPFPTVIEEFLELVTTPSHSRGERAVADLVTDKLKALGCQVEEDDVGAAIGGDAGNIIARLPGRPDRPAVLFSAHMDRVSNPGRITPVVKADEDRIVSDGTTILGADDASGLAAVLDGLRRVQSAGAERGDVEVVFTVAEEVGLQGSRRLDYGRLKSKIGYVLDSGGPVGCLVNRAPTQKTVKAVVRGLSSHAGMAPEKGVNAIRVAAVALSRLREGRLSPVTTSNFGVINGGKATNIVCDLVKIRGEARSHDEGELAAYVAEVEEAFRRAAAEAGARVELAWTVEYEAFHVADDEPVVTLAAGALRELGAEVRVEAGGGGMDANHFNVHGVRSVGLSTGYAQVHTEKEEQSISQLILCGRAVAGVIAAAGRTEAVGRTRA
jgi:tripeptide aminopeptidase